MTLSSASFRHYEAPAPARILCSAAPAAHVLRQAFTRFLAFSLSLALGTGNGEQANRGERAPGAASVIGVGPLSCRVHCALTS